MQQQVDDCDRSEVLARSNFERQASSLRLRMQRAAYRLLGDWADAEDIVQEALLHAWLKYPTFDSSRSFDAWIYRITVNLCIDHHRYRKRKPLVSLDALGTTEQVQKPVRFELPDDSYDPAVRLMATQVDERLLLAIRALPSVYRVCLRLYERGLTYEQMARLCNCPLGTVRSRLSRARRLVRNAMASPNQSMNAQ